MKLHLGCGKRYLPGYTHVDLSDYPHIDYKQDIRFLPNFASDSIDLIYSSHVIEYFDKKETDEVLKEWYRILRPSGIIRLAVPDFDALVNVYHKTNDLSKILGPLYGKWQVNDEIKIYHKTVYNFVSLSKTLTSIGFIKPKIWNWRSVFIGELEGFDDYSQAYYPHMDKENGILLSLNVEAIK
jgi:predicted SAM-dependent methyltransferase